MRDPYKMLDQKIKNGGSKEMLDRKNVGSNQKLLGLKTCWIPKSWVQKNNCIRVQKEIVVHTIFWSETFFIKIDFASE